MVRLSGVCFLIKDTKSELLSLDLIDPTLPLDIGLGGGHSFMWLLAELETREEIWN